VFRDPNVVLFICFVLAAVIAVAAILVGLRLARQLGKARRRANLAEHASLRWQRMAEDRHFTPAARGGRLRPVRDDEPTQPIRRVAR
jgi:hypothetical protein